MSFRRLLVLLPLLLFVALSVFLVRRLQMVEQGQTPDLIPSAMIDKPMPDFTLPALKKDGAAVVSSALHGHVVLVNIFASWCLPCRAEHPYLIRIKKNGLMLVGINYKDKADAVSGWLQEMGNPYDVIAVDREGRTAIDFGAYGVPESYLVDKNGIIRFKQTGPLTPDIIEHRLLPLARELNQ